MRIVKYGETDLPQASGQAQFPVQFRSSLLPLQNGAYDQDGQLSYLLPKTVSYSFWVRADDGVIDTVIDNILKEAAKGKRILYATMRDATQRIAMAKLLDVSINPSARLYFPTASNFDGYEPMSCSWEMEYPFWLKEADEPWRMDHGLTMDSGLTMDRGQKSTLAMTATGQTLTVSNDGNTAQGRGLFTITVGAGGSITNFRITSDETDDFVEYTGTLIAGDILILDLLPQIARLNANDAYSSITIGATQTRFLSLELGSNTFTMSGTAISGTITIVLQHSDHFVR